LFKEKLKYRLNYRQKYWEKEVVKRPDRPTPMKVGKKSREKEVVRS